MSRIQISSLPQFIHAKRPVPEIISTLLKRRGFSDNGILSFLFAGVESLHSPFLMEQMTDAVELLRTAIVQNQTVGIFCDSDLDGISSLAVLNSVLSRSGTPLVVEYPDGKKNHYGLTIDVIERFARAGVSLLVTLDCGIRDNAEIEAAKNAGMRVLVCDHHEPEKLPDCCIVNSKASSTYPYRDLAGVGVTLKLVEALLFSYLPLYNRNIVCVMPDRDNGAYICERSKNLVISDSVRADDEQSFTAFAMDDSIVCIDMDDRQAGDLGLVNYDRVNCAQWSSMFETVACGPTALFAAVSMERSKKISLYRDEIYPLAAIGTVADIVPLDGENRIILREGLVRFSRTNDERLTILRQLAGGALNAKAIAWSISPLLNSPGRMACPELTVDFFMNKQVKENYDRIVKVNDDRRRMIDEHFMATVEKQDAEKNGECVFVVREDIAEGLTGLLATKLSDHYGIPACVLARCAGGQYKGSCRSPSPMLSHLEAHIDIFERFGGHEQAIGFSIAEENVNKLREVLSCFHSEDTPDNDRGVIELSYEEVNFALMADLLLLEPFGFGNQTPVVKLRDVPVRDVKALKNKHLKASTDIDFQEIIAWGAYQNYEKEFMKGRVSFCCVPEINEFRGKKKIAMIVSKLI